MEDRAEPGDANYGDLSLGLSSRDEGGVKINEWQQELGREHVVPLKASPEHSPVCFALALSPSGASSDSSRGGSGRSVTPKKVYSRLSKTNAYIGFFHYAPRWARSTCGRELVCRGLYLVAG